MGSLYIRVYISATKVKHTIRPILPKVKHFSARTLKFTMLIKKKHVNALLWKKKVENQEEKATATGLIIEF